MVSLTLTRPDDFHLHLRDGAALASVIGDSTRQFARAVIMPNLKPPLINVEQVLAYRQRIIEVLPEASTFQPLMTLYLTDSTSPEDIRAAVESEHIHAVKYYPAGATTHSDNGVTRIENLFDVLEQMAESGLPLLLHGEVTDPDVDIYDREKIFIDVVLDPLLKRFPGLRVVLEHVSTLEAVQFITRGPENLAATVTPQHLIYNRNALYQQGLRPHRYCLPVLKREAHRRAVLEAAVSGNPRFFLGTDSAPHPRHDKETGCGCAGIYSAYNALELYAEVFEEAGAQDKLEAFACFHGADFYGLPRNNGTVTLEKRDWTVPLSLPFADDEVVPLKAGENCSWKLVSHE